MLKHGAPNRDRFREWFIVGIAWVVAFDVAFLWQRIAGAHTSEFGGTPDESGHYVTGLMAHDYFVAGFPGNPLAYVKTYKAHYPNVGLGQWPPVFYVTQALWTLPLGTGRTSLMLLLCGLAAVLGAFLFRVLREEFGIAVAMSGVAILVCLPLFREYYSTITPEMLAAIFMFAATINFGRYLEEERASRAIWFGVLAGLAIMTEWTALALALFVPIAVLLYGNLRVLAKPAFWGGTALAALIAGPWTWYFGSRGSTGSNQLNSGASTNLTEAIQFYVGKLGVTLGLFLALLLCIGLFARLRHRSARRGLWAAFAGLIAAVLLFHSLGSASLDGRHLIPVLPAAVTLAVAGAVVVQKWLSQRWKRVADARFPIISISLLLLALVAQEITSRTLNLSPAKHWSGYAKLADELLSDAHGKEQSIMISSDPVGEGVFTAELAMRENRPGHIVKAAGKELTRTDSIRGDPRPRFESEDDVAIWFAKAGVDYLLIDESIPEEERTQAHDQLIRAVDAHSDRFWPMARHTITRDGQMQPSPATIYRVKHVE